MLNHQECDGIFGLYNIYIFLNINGITAFVYIYIIEPIIFWKQYLLIHVAIYKHILNIEGIIIIILKIIRKI